MPMSHNAPAEERMIKILLKNPDGEIESVWAEQITKNTAIIWNIPGTTPGWGYGDFVRFDNNRFAVERLLAQTDTEYLEYSIDGLPDHVTERYRNLATYFRNNGVQVEGAGPGLALAARPYEMTATEFRLLCDRSPIPCECWEEPE